MAHRHARGRGRPYEAPAFGLIDGHGPVRGRDRGSCHGTAVFPEARPADVCLRPVRRCTIARTISAWFYDARTAARTVLASARDQARHGPANPHLPSVYLASSSNVRPLPPFTMTEVGKSLRSGARAVGASRRGPDAASPARCRMLIGGGDRRRAGAGCRCVSPFHVSPRGWPVRSSWCAAPRTG
jgi:hypothetical protein